MIAQLEGPSYTAIDPDVRLMLRVAKDDDVAFRRLIKKYEVRVRNLMAQLVRQPELVPDLTQEAFMRVYRNRNRYVPTARFWTWLSLIARNVASNCRRTLRRRREVRGDVQGGAGVLYLDSLDPCFTPPEHAQLAEVATMVHLAIESLGERQQTAIRLLLYREMSYTEIAETMNVTTMAVKSLLARARSKLQSSLQPYLDHGELPAGVDQTTWSQAVKQQCTAHSQFRNPTS
jgi:RNA polymerase sigma-70 factor, ECF subfamily